MADTKITALAAIATVDPAADVLPIVDISDTSMAASGTTKKVTTNQILGAGGTATLASATITGAATVGTTLGVTGVSTFAAGTLSLPALTTTGDTNTGIFFPAADTFAVTTGGTERYRVDSTGLGIGRSPISKLNVDKASQTPGGTTPNGAFVITDNVGSNLALEFGVNSASSPWIQSRNSTVNSYYNLFLNPDGGNIAVGTTSSGGSISNTSQILAGIFSTLIGTASSVVTATPTTIFAAPSESTLMVTAYVSGAAPSDYKVVAIVKVSGGVVAITTLSSATSVTITASGTNIQVTQTSGGSQNVGFNVLRLA